MLTQTVKEVVKCELARLVELVDDLNVNIIAHENTIHQLESRRNELENQIDELKWDLEQ